MQRAVWKFAVPLLLFGLLVLGFSVSSAFALSPLTVSYNPTPVVVNNNSSSSSTTSTTTQSTGTTTTGTTGTTTTGTTTTGTTTTTPSSSAVVVNSAASPLPVSLHSDARSLHHSNNNFHNDYRYNRDYYYRHNDYRDYNNYSVIVSSRGKQCRQPAAGELQSDARSLQHSNNNFHNDYRDYWHNHNYSNSNSCRYYRPDCR